jgi:arylsulfatase A-like enzyme
MNSEDILPTLLGLCGIEVPESVEGIDFSDYMLGGDNPSDNAALISCIQPFGQWPRAKGGREYRGVRTLRFSYTRGLEGPWQLFDNVNDPYQLENLCNRLEWAGVQADLEATLARKLHETGDDFRPGPEYLEEWNYEVDATGTVPYEN